MAREPTYTYLHGTASYHDLGQLLESCLNYYDSLRKIDDKSVTLNAMTFTIGTHANSRSMRRKYSGQPTPGEQGYLGLVGAIHGLFRIRGSLVNTQLMAHEGAFYKQMQSHTLEGSDHSELWNDRINGLIAVYREIEKQHQQINRDNHDPAKAGSVSPDRFGAVLQEQLQQLQQLQQSRGSGKPLNLAQLWDVIGGARRVYLSVKNDQRHRDAKVPLAGRLPVKGGTQDYTDLGTKVDQLINPLVYTVMDGLSREDEIHLTLKDGHGQPLPITVANYSSPQAPFKELPASSIIIGLMAGKGLLDPKTVPPSISEHLETMGTTTAIVDHWEDLIAAIRKPLAKQVGKAQAQIILNQNGLGLSARDMEMLRVACRSSVQEMEFLKRIGDCLLPESDKSRAYAKTLDEVRRYAGVKPGKNESLAQTPAQMALVSKLVYEKTKQLIFEVEIDQMSKPKDAEIISEAQSRQAGTELDALNQYYVKFAKASGADKVDGAIADLEPQPHLIEQQQVQPMKQAADIATHIAQQIKEAVGPDKPIKGLVHVLSANKILGLATLLGQSIEANRNSAYDMQLATPSAARG